MPRKKGISKFNQKSEETRLYSVDELETNRTIANRLGLRVAPGNPPLFFTKHSRTDRNPVAIRRKPRELEILTRYSEPNRRAIDATRKGW